MANVVLDDPAVARDRIQTLEGDAQATRIQREPQRQRHFSHAQHVAHTAVAQRIQQFGLDPLVEQGLKIALLDEGDEILQQ